MLYLSKQLCVMTFFAVTLVFAATSVAIEIQYEVTDLPDTTDGEDLWQFAYTVSNATFSAGQGFTVLFDHHLYSDIEDTPLVNDDWEVIVWQPDLNLPDPGAFDALAVTSMADGASLEEAFIVRFVWLGDGTPASQPFEVYQELPFIIMDTGTTSPKDVPVENPWDVNRDARVDIFDLVLVAGEFGKTPPDNLATDINGDGTVNIFDLVSVGTHFGEVYSTAAPIALSAVSEIDARLTMQQAQDGHIIARIDASPSTKPVGYYLNLQFDPEQLSVVDVESSAALGASAFQLPLKITDGQLHLLAVALNPGNAAHTDDSFATVTFRAKGEAASTVRGGHVQMVDADGRVTIAHIRAPEERLRPAPAHSSLLQNYPNPFNPETWIPYTLAASSPVTIRIYSHHGKLLRTLALGFQPAGAYINRSDAAYWDGQDESGERVASGLYYYTIDAGAFKHTRKMLIAK